MLAKRSAILTASAFLIMVGLAFPMSITMGVGEEVNGEMKTLWEKTSNGVYNFSIEFYNSGSVPYSAIARLDIFDGQKRVFTSWENSADLPPGKRVYFNLFGFVNKSGNYSPRIRIYFANEMMEKWYEPEQVLVSERQDPFMVSNINSGDNYIEFDLVSDQDVDNAILLPSKYPQGWVFHQAPVSLKANITSRQRLYFEPDIKRSINSTLIISSGSGLYAKAVDFNIGGGGDDLLSGITSFLGWLFHP